MTTFQTVIDEEMKRWRYASFMEELSLMGYDSYQEYLDEQVREAAEEYRDFNESREF